MALQDLLDMSNKRKKIGISEERLEPILPVLGQYIGFWRCYPDLFVDFLQNGGDPTIEKKLNLFFYQRVFLRVCTRYRYVYMTYPRAYSKSFLSTLAQMIRCVLYPGAHLFVTSGGKSQAAGIVKDKVNEICNLIPAFDREIDRRPGKTLEQKDYVKYLFKNGSTLDILVASERTRGARRHGGILEECVSIDGDILSQVIIPTMNVARRKANGEVDPDEVLSKSQIYITTAGDRNTFPYRKLIQLLTWMIVEPGKAFVGGGSWRIPVLYGLQEKQAIIDQKKDETMTEQGFAREYESKWCGASADAFFNGDDFDKNRILLLPEYSHSGRSSVEAQYFLGVDVGRLGCATVITVIKMTPQFEGNSLKSLVNIIELNNMHFEEQAIILKKLYTAYKAQRIIIDGNGIGAGLIDYLVKTQIDENTGEKYSPFGVYNDEKGVYKQFRTNTTIDNAIYIIKANAPINTEAHANLRIQLQNGRLKLLISENDAKLKLLNTTRGKGMTLEERSEYLKPFTLTSILREEMLNLREKNDGINIILERANRLIEKDKFSSLEYVLYYIRVVEERKKKKRFNAADWKFHN